MFYKTLIVVTYVNFNYSVVAINNNFLPKAGGGPTYYADKTYESNFHAAPSKNA